MYTQMLEIRTGCSFLQIISQFLHIKFRPGKITAFTIQFRFFSRMHPIMLLKGIIKYK
jgi:hypothetical protein